MRICRKRLQGLALRLQRGRRGSSDVEAENLLFFGNRVIKDVARRRIAPGPSALQFIVHGDPFGLRRLVLGRIQKPAHVVRAHSLDRCIVDLGTGADRQDYQDGQGGLRRANGSVVHVQSSSLFRDFDELFPEVTAFEQIKKGRWR